MYFVIIYTDTNNNIYKYIHIIIMVHALSYIIYSIIYYSSIETIVISYMLPNGNYDYLDKLLRPIQLRASVYPHKIPRFLFKHKNNDNLRSNIKPINTNNVSQLSCRSTNNLFLTVSLFSQTQKHI